MITGLLRVAWIAVFFAGMLAIDIAEQGVKGWASRLSAWAGRNLPARPRWAFS